eukprot:10424533-Prorocentrum_lima.AAC.1
MATAQGRFNSRWGAGLERAACWDGTRAGRRPKRAGTSCGKGGGLKVGDAGGEGPRCDGTLGG